MSRLVEAAGGNIVASSFARTARTRAATAANRNRALLRQSAATTAVPLTGVPVVGDSARDLEAAVAVGARPILVLSGNGVHARAALQAGTYELCADLLDAARLLAEDGD